MNECKIEAGKFKGNFYIDSKKYLWSKYFVTTPEPGARLVFIHGLTWRMIVLQKH